MRRYWIEFADAAPLRPDTALAFGIGVTAWTVGQALRMAELAFGPPLPEVARVVEDVDVSALALPPRGLGVSVWPGVWYPPINLWIANREWPA